MRIQGTITKWTDRGYGFCNGHDGVNYFCHASHIERGYGHDDLLEGSVVEFEPAPSKRQPGKFEAHSIKVVSEPDL